jgi:hypothetical protein
LPDLTALGRGQPHLSLAVLFLQQKKETLR